MLDKHFKEWSNEYRHYIDPWYGKLCIWFTIRGFEPPSKLFFYIHCYNNSRKYYDRNLKREVPPIVLTPLHEEELI